MPLADAVTEMALVSQSPVIRNWLLTVLGVLTGILGILLLFGVLSGEIPFPDPRILAIPVLMLADYYLTLTAAYLIRRRYAELSQVF